MADEADAAVEAFEAAVGEAEVDGGEDALAVAADRAGELDELLEPGAGGSGQPAVEVGGCEGGVLELVEQPELFFEQERAVERLVGLLDTAELCELIERLLGRALWPGPRLVVDSLTVRIELTGRVVVVLSP